MIYVVRNAVSVTKLMGFWKVEISVSKPWKVVKKNTKKQEIGKRKDSKSQENRKRKTLNRRRKDVKKNRPNSKNKNKNQIKVKEENKDNQIFADLSSLCKQTNKKKGYVIWQKKVSMGLLTRALLAVLKGVKRHDFAGSNNLLALNDFIAGLFFDLLSLHLLCYIYFIIIIIAIIITVIISVGIIVIIITVGITVIIIIIIEFCPLYTYYSK